MRQIWFITVTILLAAPGGATAATDCTSASCYRPAPPFGHDVKIDGGGDWVDRQAPAGTRHGLVVAAANPDQRNAEISYQTAYDSFMEGKRTGGNKVEKLKGGRWTTKITTADGIVLFKDDRQNVVVRSDDGKWHMMNSQGEYRLSADDPNAWEPASAKRALAKAQKAGKKRKVAAKAKKKSTKVAKAAPAQPAAEEQQASRAPASIAADPPPAADAAPAPNADAAAAAQAAPSAEASAAPAAEAAAPAPSPAAAPAAAAPASAEKLSPMDALRKLAESPPASAAPAAAAAPAGAAATSASK